VSPELSEESVPEGLERLERHVFAIIGAWLDRAAVRGSSGTSAYGTRS
jgi:hypothetical protein